MATDENNLLVRHLKEVLATSPPVREPDCDATIFEGILKALTSMRADDYVGISQGTDDELESILARMSNAELLSYHVQKHSSDLRASLSIGLLLKDGVTAQLHFNDLMMDDDYSDDNHTTYDLQYERRFTIRAPGVHIEAEFDEQSALGKLLGDTGGGPLSFDFNKGETLLMGQFAEETDPILQHLSKLLVISLKDSADINALLCLSVGKYDELTRAIQSDTISDEVLRLVVEGVCIRENAARDQAGNIMGPAYGAQKVLDEVAQRLPGSLIEEVPFYQNRIIPEGGALVVYPKVLEMYLKGAPSEVVNHFMETVPLASHLRSLALREALQDPKLDTPKLRQRRF